MARLLNIAAAQYNFDPVRSVSQWREKITRWVEQAVGQGSQVLVFPEYAAMELTSIDDRGLDLEGSIDAVSDLTHEIIAIHCELARKHGVTIIAGSGPFKNFKGVCNVAQVFGPRGAHESFTKIMPTPWERDPWHINGGRELKVFDIGIAKIGVLICYDIEFPLLSRALAEAGAEVIFAPSNTETAWGYWRVRIGAQARALENQIYAVQSPCVGAASFCKAIENNVGAAGIFGPPDRGLPHDGVVAIGDINTPQWLYATLDLDLTAELRHSGGVRTFAHWQEQPGADALPPARVIDLKGTL
jgi:predicted amidohydrolase